MINKIVMKKSNQDANVLVTFLVLSGTHLISSMIGVNRKGEGNNGIKTSYGAGETPAKVLAFFTNPAGGILALIHPTEFTNHSDDSCLTVSYKLS
jgi:hypothetical protein